MRKYDISRMYFAGGVLFAVILTFMIFHKDMNRLTTMINGFPATQ